MSLTQAQRDILLAARRAIDAYIQTIPGTPSAVNDNLTILRPWKPGAFVVGDVRRHGGVPYKCVQAHDSTANPGWTPDATPALWMQYHGTSPETARPYLQPQGAHDAYQKDEYAIVDGVVYRCKTNATVGPPATVPANWAAV
jgi:hypothetical protein